MKPSAHRRLRHRYEQRVHHPRLQAALCNAVRHVGQLACSARRDEVERALHQLLKLLLVPPLNDLLAELVPQVSCVDVIQARAVGSKEPEQLVGVAGMRDVAVELRSIEMTTGSRAAR